MDTTPLTTHWPLLSGISVAAIAAAFVLWRISAFLIKLFLVLLCAALGLGIWFLFEHLRGTPLPFNLWTK